MLLERKEPEAGSLEEAGDTGGLNPGRSIRTGGGDQERAS